MTAESGLPFQSPAFLTDSEMDSWIRIQQKMEDPQRPREQVYKMVFIVIIKR